MLIDTIALDGKCCAIHHMDSVCSRYRAIPQIQSDALITANDNLVRHIAILFYQDDFAILYSGKRSYQRRISLLTNVGYILYLGLSFCR